MTKIDSSVGRVLFVPLKTNRKLTYIKWSFMGSNNLPVRDSVLIAVNDTTYYNIEY
ncbi:MAG TPA: hypothetical protein PK228_20435 [Saprospiraceae bacterium]|nr:hypothetical protein [Saprospiraceae bacterium]